nr:protein SIEVE ELEMENT OCCLUSION B-like [Ipomoea batatas]
MAAQTPLVSQRIISQPTMMLTTSLSSQSVDESIIREQVLSTHNYDGREFDTNFILSMAENTLNLETGTAHQKVMVEELNQLEELDTYKELPLHIRQLSLEIASGAIATNQHSTTIHHVLSIVSPYSWEDNLVLLLAAFSIIHGESSLISPLRKGKGLALKQTTAEEYCCISSAIELTKCVVQLKQWLSYSPPQSLILALPMAAYWIATTVVNCASYAYARDPHFKLQNEHREITALMATFSAELAIMELENEISDAANNIRCWRP